MVNLEPIPAQPNLQEEFAYRQIGAITCQIEPVDVSTSLDFVMEYFRDNPASYVIPIERNGILIGILDRSVVEKEGDSAWARFWQKDLDAYIQSPLMSLRADDYIEKNIPRVLELNKEKGTRFFAVFYRKSFFGIVGLHEMLERMTDLRNRDLSKARQVQQHLLDPGEQKSDQRYSLLTYNQMANEVGGDFFKDTALADGEKHIIGCFDVSGKNVAASLSTMAIGSVLTALRHFEIGERFGAPTTVLIDKYILDLTPEDMFITAALCYVNFADNSILLQNCGHTPMYIFVPGEDGKIAGRTMNPNMPPLGMGILGADGMSGFRLPITKGLRIVLYTDGLTDMLTPGGSRFDDERTKALFLSAHGKGMTETKALYEKAIAEWISEAMLPDDITIMDLRFN